MLGTRAEEIFEVLKTFLSPGSIWQNVLVPQHDLSKSFSTPTTKLEIAQKIFLSLLQLYNSFIPLTLNKKHSKEFNNFLKLWFKMILTFKNNTSPDTVQAP